MCRRHLRTGPWTITAVVVVIVLAECASAAAQAVSHTETASQKARVATTLSFRKIKLTDEFWAEGVAIADVNRDGHQDVVVGPFWYEGPQFRRRHEYRSATRSFATVEPGGRKMTLPGFEGAQGTHNAYSDDFETFVGDFNADGWLDILVVGFPGQAANWYENPGDKVRVSDAHWKVHPVLDSVGNESPVLGDLFHDGRPVLLCISRGYLGYASPVAGKPYAPWVFHRISSRGDYGVFTHGLGYGDINGDGRADVLEANGWYEQPPDPLREPPWRFHPHSFNLTAAHRPPYGGAQMYVYDVNGDGRPDVITVLAAHNYGLAWFEQLRPEEPEAEITFTRHLILSDSPPADRQGVEFSEMHALGLADLNGDGLPDLVTGKRYWAHGKDGAGLDDEPNTPAVLYWLEQQRDTKGVRFVPHLIDADSGVGTQIALADIDGDGLTDVAVSNKKGAFIFLQQRKATP